MAENKKSFVAYCDWENQLDLLSDEEAGKLFRHLLAYVNDRNPEFSHEDRILKMAFEPIRLQLKRDLDKYEEVKKKRSEAGRSGGLKSGESRSKTNQIEANKASASTNETKEAIASFGQKKEANEAVTVNDNDTDNVNDTVNDILLEKETKEENLIKEFFPDDKKQESVERKKVAPKKEKFRPPSVDEVQVYCNERQNGIQAFKFVNFYQSKGWKVGNQAMKDWKAAIRTWEQKNKENGQTNNNNSNNGTNYKAGGTGGGSKISGKISGRSILAREADKHSSRDSESGDFTIDVEIVE